MVELAFGYSLLFAIFSGTFAFGFILLTYNQLQSAVRGAARFASMTPYDHPNGADWEQAVENVAVYGQPTLDGDPQTLVDGLTTAHVQVVTELVNDQPKRVRVEIHDFEIDTIFWKFNLSKPAATFPFIGRVEYP
jgi:Flp pilus assembly protein TadG